MDSVGNEAWYSPCTREERGIVAMDLCLVNGGHPGYISKTAPGTRNPPHLRQGGGVSFQEKINKQRGGGRENF